MSEQKKSRPKRKSRKYVHKTNAVCITLHSVDGSTVPRPVLDAAIQRVEELAQDYNCLVNVAEV